MTTSPTVSQTAASAAGEVSLRDDWRVSQIAGLDDADTRGLDVRITFSWSTAYQREGFTGTVSCNGIGGSYLSRPDGRFEVIVGETEDQLCPSPFAARAGTFWEAWNAARAWSLSDDQLTLTLSDAAGSSVLTLIRDAAEPGSGSLTPTSATTETADALPPPWTSLPDRPRPIPEVIGFTVAEATAWLEASGFESVDVFDQEGWAESQLNSSDEFPVGLASLLVDGGLVVNAVAGKPVVF